MAIPLLHLLVLGVTIGCRFVGTAPRLILRILALSAGSTVILLALTAICSLPLLAHSRCCCRTASGPPAAPCPCQKPGARPTAWAWAASCLR